MWWFIRDVGGISSCTWRVIGCGRFRHIDKLVRSGWHCFYTAMYHNVFFLKKRKKYSVDVNIILKKELHAFIAKIVPLTPSYGKTYDLNTLFPWDFYPELLKHRIFWLQNLSKRKDIAVYHSTSSTLIVSPKLQKGVNNKWIQKFIRVWKEDQN